jgi:hypothetical protein
MGVIYVEKISMEAPVFQNHQDILSISTICQQEALSLGACTKGELMVVRTSMMEVGQGHLLQEVFP